MLLAYEVPEDAQKGHHRTRPSQRAKTRRLPCEAAGKKKPQAYWFSPSDPESAKTAPTRLGYVEDFFSPRTKLGKGRALARLGWRVE